MRRLVIGVIGVTIALALPAVMLPAEARDLGIGGFVSAGAGSSDITIENNLGPDLDADGDNGSFGFGFVFDSAVRGDTLFNYRIQAGFEISGADVDYDIAGDDDLGFAGATFDNDFGFRIYGNDQVRLWIGPRVRIGIFGGEFDDDNNLYNQDDNEIDVGMVEFGLGGVFGANLHLADSFDMGITAGYRQSWYNGTLEDDFGNDLDFEADGGNAFIGFSFLWVLK